jgi:hypothetical protein
MMKEIVKRAPLVVKSRVIPDVVVRKWRDAIAGVEGDVADIMKQEDMEKEVRWGSRVGL